MFIGLIFLLPVMWSVYKVWYFDYSRKWYAFKYVLIFFFMGLFAFILLAATAMSGIGHSQPSGMSIQEENVHLMINMVTVGLSVIGLIMTIYKSTKRKKTNVA